MLVVRVFFITKGQGKGQCAQIVVYVFLNLLIRPLGMRMTKATLASKSLRNEGW